MDMRICVELVGAIRFLEHLVDGCLEVGIELLEQVFEEKREQLTSPVSWRQGKSARVG